MKSYSKYTPPCKYNQECDGGKINNEYIYFINWHTDPDLYRLPPIYFSDAMFPEVKVHFGRKRNNLLSYGPARNS